MWPYLYLYLSFTILYNLHFRLAVKYIKHMQYLMAIPPNQNIPQHIVEFDPGVPSWRKNPQVPFFSYYT